MRRAKPGERSGGEYYRVIVRPKGEFSTFRVHDIGKEGHAQRLAGKRPNGRWDTQAWLINKNDAHIEQGKLVADEPKTKQILNKLSTVPRHVKGDIFRAKDRRDIPEKEKPTPAQKRARQKNIKKAQRARKIKEAKAKIGWWD